MQKLKLSNTEEYLMNIFWAENAPLTSADLVQLSEEKEWSSAYIHRMLASLKTKKFIATCGMTQEDNHYSRLFKPCFSKDEYIVKILKEKNVGTASFGKIAMGLVKKATGKKAEEQNKKLVADLQDMIDQFRGKIEEIEGGSNSE